MYVYHVSLVNCIDDEILQFVGRRDLAFTNLDEDVYKLPIKPTVVMPRYVV